LAADAGDQIDWWQVDIYWGDERCVPPDSLDSNERLGREALLERVGAANAIYPMRCEEGPDPYQQRIAQAGRLDFVHLGLGPAAPASFHRLRRPAAPPPSPPPGPPPLDPDPGRLVVLNEAPTGNNPLPRMTLTLSGLPGARLVVFTVSGEAKREAFARVRAGDP